MRSRPRCQLHGDHRAGERSPQGAVASKNMLGLHLGRGRPNSGAPSVSPNASVRERVPQPDLSRERSEEWPRPLPHSATDPVVRVDRAADLAHFSHRCHAELPHEQLDVSLVACAACAYLHCEHVARRCSGHDQIGRVEEHLRGLVLTIRHDSVSEDSEHTLECDPQALGIQCRLGDAPCSGRGSAIDRRGAGKGKGRAAAPYPPRDSSFVLLSRLGESVQAHRRYLLPCSLAH